LFINTTEVGAWLNDITPGTVTASKAMVVDASSTIDALTITAANIPTIDRVGTMSVGATLCTALIIGRATKSITINGNVSLTGTIQGQKRVVTAHTAGDTLAATETGTVHTTVGASGTVTFSLPAATVGTEFFFRVGAAQELRLDPDGTETIALPSTGVQGAAGKYLTANADGESVHIACDKAGEWTVYGYTGTWTAEA